MLQSPQYYIFRKSQLPKVGGGQIAYWSPAQKLGTSRMVVVPMIYPHAIIYIYFAPVGMRSIVMSMSAYLSVCVSVSSHILKTMRPNFTKFLCMLPVAVAWSFSYGIVVCYVLPVLLTTSWVDGHNVVWLVVWAWLLARRGPLWPTDSLAGLRGSWVHISYARHTGRGAGYLAAGLGCCGDCGACFAVCFMLVVSCAPEAKSAICDCIVCLKTHTHSR